jgi:hypothetical protein
MSEVAPPPPLTNDICDEGINVACGDVVLGDTSDDTDSGGNAAPDEFYAFTGAGIPQDVTFHCVTVVLPMIHLLEYLQIVP